MSVNRPEPTCTNRFSEAARCRSDDRFVIGWFEGGSHDRIRNNGRIVVIGSKSLCCLTLVTIQVNVRRVSIVGLNPKCLFGSRLTGRSADWLDVRQQGGHKDQSIRSMKLCTKPPAAKRPQPDQAERVETSNTRPSASVLTSGGSDWL